MNGSSGYHILQNMDAFSPLLSFLAILLFFTVKVSTNEGHAESTVIGAIIDNSSRIGKEERVAIEMAMEDFHDYSNQTFLHQINDSRGEPIRAALAASDLIKTHQVQVILGPQTWEETSLVADVGSKDHVPILSFADDTPKWATKQWPFLVQASPNQFAQMKAVAAIVQSWEWHQVTVIFEDTDSSASRVIPHLFDALTEVGVEMIHRLPLPPFTTSSLSKELESLKRGQCRVFVVDLSLSLAMNLFETAKKMKMMENGYVWITTNPITSLVHTINASAVSSMQGVIGVKSYFHTNEPRFEDFRLRFRKRFSLKHRKEKSREPGIVAVQAYDAVWTVCLAMLESKKGEQDQQLLLDKILQSNFSGLVRFSDQKLAPGNIFQIINMMGKSYRELGFWSSGSGFGFSKTIAENATYNSSMKHLGQVFWPGGPWNVPRGWTPPTTAYPLRIGVPTVSTFKNYVNVTSDDHLINNISFRGFTIDLFKATLLKLPFGLPYTFLPFNGSYDELVEQIHLKKFDAVVGDVAILAKRYKHAEFTQPYTESGLVMVVPVQSKNDKAWLFLKPFTMAMWVLIAAINVYNGFVVWLIERNHSHELKGSALNQMAILLCLSFRTLFSLNGEKLHSTLSRIAMVAWLFVALVIMQTYTANLTSMLTVQQLEPTVTNIESLQKSNAIVGYSKATFVEKYLVEALRFNPNNVKNYTKPDEYAEDLKNRKIGAMFLELPVAKLFLGRYCKGYTIAGPIYKVGGWAFVFPKGSPLLPLVTEALLKVLETGELRELENSMVATQKCKEVESDDEGPSLSPNSFSMLFILTGGTSTVALVIYIFHFDNPTLSNKTTWRLMLAVMKQWSDRKKWFRRRVGNGESLTNSSNIAMV